MHCHTTVMRNVVWEFYTVGVYFLTIIDVVNTAWLFFIFKKLFLFVFLKRFYLFLEREREEDREGNIRVWLPLKRPLLGTWPTTQTWALTGNQTGNYLVHRLAFNPLTHSSQGFLIFNFIFLLLFSYSCPAFSPAPSSPFHSQSPPLSVPLSPVVLLSKILNVNRLKTCEKNSHKLDWNKKNIDYKNASMWKQIIFQWSQRKQLSITNI